MLVDRRDVLAVHVAKEDVVPVAQEPRSDRPSDRARSDDDELHRAILSALP
jgi:hypothetical protein